jgi:serine/threonine-protein kinase
MRNCPTEDAVLAFVGGTVTYVSRGEMEHHLAECGDCRELVSELARDSRSGLRHSPGATTHALGAGPAPTSGDRPSTAAADVVPDGAHPGQVIGDKYEVERVLGLGGMGVVVAAWHRVLGEKVAIKFPLPELRDAPEVHERLLREARACARLRSEHAVRLLDVGTLDTGLPYVVMEYLAGRTLAERLRDDGVLPVPLAVDSIVQACDALEEAHAAGIVHRDLKPSNLFETRRFDGSTLVKVLDFGIAKAPAHAGAEPLTTTHAIMGSPAYMAPEQLRNTRDVDARADIWALGVTLQELVTGDRATTGVARIRPAGLARVLQRCLRDEPAQRYGSARELAEALVPYGSDLSRGVVSRLRAQAPPAPGARSRAWLLAACVGAAALVGAGAWGAVRSVRRANPVALASPSPASSVVVPASVPQPPPTTTVADPPSVTAGELSSARATTTGPHPTSAVAPLRAAEHRAPPHTTQSLPTAFPPPTVAPQPAAAAAPPPVAAPSPVPATAPTRDPHGLLDRK